MHRLSLLGVVFVSACAGSRAPASRVEVPPLAAASADASTDAGVARAADASAGDDEWRPQSEQEQRFLEMEKAAVARLREQGRHVALLAPSKARSTRGVIPADWKSVDAILLRRTWLPKGVDSEALEGVEIGWRSPSIDGRVFLVLTDEQIYLRSGHDNPHRNHIYWLAPATPAQRSAVSEFLTLQRKKHVQQPYDCDRSGTASDAGAMSCSLKAPFPERSESSAAQHLELTAKNAAAIVGRLNKILPSGVPPLPVPSASDVEMKVLVSQMADELYDWLGH